MGKEYDIGPQEGDEEPEIRVVDLSTGEEVDNAGIADMGMSIFGSALESAGISLGEPVTDEVADSEIPEIPDDISGMFPDL